MAVIAWVALVAFGPTVLSLVEPWLSLRGPSLAREAMDRVKEHPRVVSAIGQPVRARWSVVSNFKKDETGWTEGFMWIPVVGPKGEGTVYVQGGRTTGHWIFATVEFRTSREAAVSLIDQPEPAHREAPVEPEFYRHRPATEPPDGRYPCFLAGVTEAHGRPSIDARTTECLPGLRTDKPYDEYEVDLRGGFLVMRQTDLFVEDDLPLVFTRCFRMWDSISRAFGNGWNHPYDILPTGSRNPYRDVNLLMPDGEAIHYDRISEGTGYADAVYEHTATATPFLHSEFRWNGHGWDLRFPDGGLFEFPENYAGPLPHHGAPTLMQDGRGHAIRFLRDADRNLEQLTSPSGHFIRLEHDSLSRVTLAIDDRGRSVRYTYDTHGRLATVTSNDRAVRYAYVGADVIAIEALDSQNAVNRSLLRVRYGAGRVSDLEFADGRSYHFTFSVSEGSNTVTEAVVTSPEGTQTTVHPGRRP